MRWIIFLSLLCQLAMSCVVQPDDFGDRNGQEIEHYYVTVELDQPRTAADTRSAFTDEDLNRISDLNVFVYHQGILLDDHSSYFSDVSNLMLSFPCDKDGFNIYMVGNVGRLEPPYYESEIGEVCHVVDSYDEFKVRGFPIANVFKGYEKGTLAVFLLKRLIGQYNIRMCPSAVDAQYTVKDVRLLNCARDVYPFSLDSKAGLFTEVGDLLTDEDIAALNDGDYVSLYFVENLQGELLPGNTDRRKKIPSNLNELESDLADRCTYIEITSDIVTPGARYTDGIYRFYLGRNQTTDFSICRNTMYNVTLDFTQNMVNEEEWRIEVQEPEIKPISLSKETAHVVKGVNDYVIITGPKVEIDQDLSCENDIGCCGYNLSDVVLDGVSCQKLTFRTERDIERYVEWKEDYNVVASKYEVALKTVETYNGEPLERKIVTVYTYDCVFPVFIRMGTNSYLAPYQIETVTNAPIYFDFNISATLKADVGNTGTVNTYSTSISAKGRTADGYNCNYARFATLLNNVQSKNVYFRTMDVTLRGKTGERIESMEVYLPQEGKVVYGPGYAPESYSGNISGSNAFSFTQYSADGSLRYRVYDSDAGGSLFDLSYKETDGFQHRVSFDWDEFNSGAYLPFYICNGGHVFFKPHAVYNNDPPYLSSSVVGVLAKSYVPGRDVFYPNGARWGSQSEQRPDIEGNYGYLGEHMRQAFGNRKNWTTYCAYEVDFFMTINGCTAWPGAYGGSSGFVLPD